METTTQKPDPIEVLGLRPGDVVVTDYGTGPYVIDRVVGPFFHEDRGLVRIVYSAPVFSLGCSKAVQCEDHWKRDPDSHDDYHLNGYTRLDRDGDQVWCSTGGDMLTRLGQVRWMEQGSLFGGQGTYDEGQVVLPSKRSNEPVPRWQPWPRTPGCDYSAGDGHVWHCRCHEADFTTDAAASQSDRPSCPNMPCSYMPERGWPDYLIFVGVPEPGTSIERTCALCDP